MRFNLRQRLQSRRMVASLAALLKNPTELDSVFGAPSPQATQMQRHRLENQAMAALVAEGWRPCPTAAWAAPTPSSCSA